MEDNDKWLTTLQVSELFNVSQRTITRQRHKYEFVWGKGLGGKKVLIKLSSLPADIQLKYQLDDKIRSLANEKCNQQLANQTILNNIIALNHHNRTTGMIQL